MLTVTRSMEWFRFLREHVWHNAGFGSLRRIAPLIEEYEPWFEPTIIPTPLHGLTDSPDPPPASIEKERPRYPGPGYYSVEDYHALYLSGELTPTEVAKALLPLIQRDITPAGAHSAAWFDTKVDLVLKAAEASTMRYRQKCPLGPLDGVPTAVKDEYDVEGYVTCLGSRNDYTGTSREDDTISTWCVRKLEAAGAVNLGKLSMHEFGLDITGNNPVYDTPRNPHNANYYTGGSSSGTGYAVSAGLIPIGLGSDGGGSIRIPASMCGVFGLKPTNGRISFRPGQNHCLTCAALGPLASDIRSLAILFETIAEPHPTSPFPVMPPLRLSSSSPSGRDKLLGIPEAWFARSAPAVQSQCRSLINRLVKEHGYRTVAIDIPFLPEGQTAHAMTVLTDAATLLPETRGLTAANRVMLALGRVTPATDYLLAQKLRRVLMQHLAHLWREHGSDMLIVTPTTACAGWPILSEGELRHGVSDGDRTMQGMEYVWLANYCGLPSLSVPAGFVVPVGAAEEGTEAGPDVPGKIPVGLMATGEWCSEERLLEFGLDAEQAGMERMVKPPIWVDVVETAMKQRSST